MSRCGFDEGCDRPKGWRLNITGGTGEDRIGGSLVFDVENPCGVELSAAGEEIAPLRQLASWSGCVGQDESGIIRPGARVLVTGHVMSRRRDALAAGVINFESPDDCGAGVVSSQPLLKLRVTSCGLQGSVIIDSDSQVVMPAGAIQIDVLGPADWQLMGTINTEVPTLFVDTWLVVRACPLDCCWCPEGVLTEWLSLDSEVPGERILVRPRRAVQLAAQAATAIGPPFGASNVTVVWQHEPLIGGPGYGATTFVATQQQTVDQWGAAPFLRVTPPSQNARATLRWTIR